MADLLFTHSRAMLRSQKEAFLRWLCLSLLLLIGVGTLDAAQTEAKDFWSPVSTEELAGVTPIVEPGAAAEAILYKVEIDDRKYPRERSYRVSVRYKIYDPEGASAVLSTHLILRDGDEVGRRGLQLRARLTLPSGECKEFGSESFLERTWEDRSRIGGRWWLRRNRQAVKERFLAISGVERGSVLEYRFQYKRDLSTGAPTEFWTLQMEGIPIWQAEYIHTYKGAAAPGTIYLLNSQQAHMEQSEGIVRVTASKVPSILYEPFVGPESDYAITVVNCDNEIADNSEVIRWYAARKRENEGSSTRIRTGRWGPWVTYAAAYALAEDSLAQPTSRLKKLAANLTAKADSEIEKARRIHAYLSGVRQQYAIRDKGPDLRVTDKPPASPNEVIDFDKTRRTFSDFDFLMLGIALNRAAGLETHTILLPDRTVARFDPQLVAADFLADTCIGIQIDGRWYFSCPHTDLLLPFDLLPWQNEGQVGLVAEIERQEFIAVPLPSAEASTIKYFGRFRLDEKGSVAGECQSTYRGHCASGLRVKMRDQNYVDRKKTVKGLLREGAPAEAEFDVRSISGIENPDAPLVVTYTLHWSGYASFTKNLMIFRPSIFRATAVAPFPDTDRRAPVQFPFKWGESDDVVIELPSGFRPVAPAAPASYPGEVIDYRTELKMAHDRTGQRSMLVLNREFSSSAIEVAGSDYADLKQWYDAIGNSDRHELALTKVSGPPSAPSPVAP